MSEPHLEDLPCFQLYLGWRRAQALYKPALAPLLCPQRLYVLQLLERGEPSMGDLARALDVEPGSISGLVSRMERDGLVERRRGTEDRLTVRVRATRRGKTLRRRAQRSLLELDERLLAEIGERDLAALQRVVRVLGAFADEETP